MEGRFLYKHDTLFSYVKIMKFKLSSKYWGETLRSVEGWQICVVSFNIFLDLYERG